MAELWKDEYKLGNEKIDEQHRQLFEKIESLLETARSGDEESNRQECMKIIDFLIEYSMFHFETEEQLQRDKRYVSYDRHVKIHKNFKNTVEVYKELLDRDFSAKNLKKFIGTLIAWLTNHVCVCDRKIMKNIPIKEMESFADAESFIQNVAKKLLTEIYDIPVFEAKSCIYKGSVDGAVIIRTVVEGNLKHIFLYGLSDKMTGVLYNKISGMTLGNIEQMDDIEKSALMEIGNIISTYAVSAIEDSSNSGTRFNSSLYLHEYNETDYNISNSVMLEIKTDLGKMDILYCQLK